MLIKRHRSYAVATSLLLAGIILAALGITSDTLPETIAGVILCVFGQVVACMRILHGWITNTAAEKAQLQRAAQHCSDEAQKYAAATAASDGENARLRRDRIAAARRADEALRADREALQAQFEERRNELVNEAFETAWELYQSGEMDTPTAAQQRVVVPVQFPKQPADHEPTRARGRDISS